MALVGLVRWLALAASRHHERVSDTVLALARAVLHVQAVHAGVLGALAVWLLQGVPPRHRQVGGSSVTYRIKPWTLLWSVTMLVGASVWLGWPGAVIVLLAQIDPQR